VKWHDKCWSVTTEESKFQVYCADKDPWQGCKILLCLFWKTNVLLTRVLKEEEEKGEEEGGTTEEQQFLAVKGDAFPMQYSAVRHPLLILARRIKLGRQISMSHCKRHETKLPGRFPLASKHRNK